MSDDALREAGTPWWLHCGATLQCPDRAEGLWILRSGSLAIVSATQPGASLDYILPGELASERLRFWPQPGPRPMACARSDCELRRLSWPEYHRLCREQPARALSLADEITAWGAERVSPGRWLAAVERWLADAGGTVEAGVATLSAALGAHPETTRAVVQRLHAAGVIVLRDDGAIVALPPLQR
ncbi:hypothetical protein [Arhodomonas sp. SL1]|uniref:hypothetical protein n=1 Tax=Arhodomonas sp. SL1 TaxID=3425691 RepID=UPI003F883292